MGKTQKLMKFRNGLLGNSWFTVCGFFVITVVLMLWFVRTSIYSLFGIISPSQSPCLFSLRITQHITLVYARTPKASSDINFFVAVSYFTPDLFMMSLCRFRQNTGYQEIFHTGKSFLTNCPWWLFCNGPKSEWGILVPLKLVEDRMFALFTECKHSLFMWDEEAKIM